MRKDIYERTKVMKNTNEKVNYSQIARTYNADPRTVKKYYEGDEKCKERKKREIKKKLDEFEEIIEEKMRYGAPATGIYYCLVDKYGYDGSYSLIKKFVKDKKTELIQKATIRYETSPGLQCQIDWKENLKLISKNEEEFIIYIFLAILGYSRMKYIELTLDKTQETLFSCHINLFKYFGGVPREFLYDNMRTVVDISRTQFSEPVYNDTFAHFAKDAGFTPMSCVSYRPCTKGKVETLAKIMNRLKAYNHEFNDIEELKEIIKDLLNKLNNEEKSCTTGCIPVERFQKEKEHLNPEPNYDILYDYIKNKPIRRKVTKESLITYNGKRYSVPNKYIGKEVDLVVQDNTLRIYYSSNFVEMHPITEKKISYSVEDYTECLKSVFPNSTGIEGKCIENLSMLDKL